MTTELSRAESDAPTSELVTPAVGDICANCQSPLASDQRYCVNCGARRGKPRFTTEQMAAQTSSAPLQASERPATPRSRVSAATTLVAGVATLLLAMGVGVLIGHNNSTPTRAAAPQIISVGGGAGAAAPSGTASSGKSKASKTKATKVKVVHLSPKNVKAAGAAATKVLGAAAPKNPTATVGQSCVAGQQGCQNGKFNGSFFGP